MYIIVVNDGENQVTVIRTINNYLATSHTAVLSADGRIVKHNTVIRRKCSDESWEQVNHPDVTPLLKCPNAEVVEVLNMPAVECITSVIDDAGVWNHPTGRDSDNLLSDMIAIVDVDRTMFTQDIVDADEYVPVWSTSYVRDYYNSAFTSLELQLANTLLHVTSALRESVRSRNSSIDEPKAMWNPLISPLANIDSVDEKKDPPVTIVIGSKYNPIAAAVDLFDIEEDGRVEDTRIDKSYSQVPDFQATDDLEDCPTYRGMDISDLD